MHAFVVVGSRPEAIKMAPVVHELRRRPSFRVTLCSTDQQRDLIPRALCEFALAPDLSLDVMRAGQSLSQLTSRLMAQLGPALQSARPDVVLVQGDTTSAMAGALAAFYERIPVGHVEAGMRTSDRYAPYPEEINRRMITQCTTSHFAPTSGCRDNLVREGVCADAIDVTGNTVIDALLWTVAKLRNGPTTLPGEIDAAIEGRRVLLVTSHRRENIGRGMDEIGLALRDVADAFEDVAIVYPVHPNPQVAAQMRGLLANRPRILLVPPQPYRPFIELMLRADLILTDSGGLQEEAPSLGKPVLVMRQTTERPEGVEKGVALLVGADRRSIVDNVSRLLEDPGAYAAMQLGNPYGDGRSAVRIADRLEAGIR